jgi:hypothetical protein
LDFITVSIAVRSVCNRPGRLELRSRESEQKVAKQSEYLPAAAECSSQVTGRNCIALFAYINMPCYQPERRANRRFERRGKRRHVMAALDHSSCILLSRAQRGGNNCTETSAAFYFTAHIILAVCAGQILKS